MKRISKKVVSRIDTFERLASKLDELPEGFPGTESGVELKILRKIFISEEAEMALMMRPAPETAEEIAEVSANR